MREGERVWVEKRSQKQNCFDVHLEVDLELKFNEEQRMFCKTLRDFIGFLDWPQGSFDSLLQIGLLGISLVLGFQSSFFENSWIQDSFLRIFVAFCGYHGFQFSWIFVDFNFQRFLWISIFKGFRGFQFLWISIYGCSWK